MTNRENIPGEIPLEAYIRPKQDKDFDVHAQERSPEERDGEVHEPLLKIVNRREIARINNENNLRNLESTNN